MIGIKDTFPSVRLDEWIQRLKKDLKSDDLQALHFHDPIEEMEFRAYNHQENTTILPQVPGSFPFTRSNRNNDARWKNGKTIQVKNAKESNAYALKILMEGIDHLDFELTSEHISLDELLVGIGIEHITISFTPFSAEQAIMIIDTVMQKFPHNVRVNIDHFNGELYGQVMNSFPKTLSTCQGPIFVANGYSLHETGANATQEIAFQLATAHAYLVDLLNQGLSVDQAAACIHFKCGVGSDYFTEIAKFRALRNCWSSVLKEYAPVHNCSYNCVITAKTGLMNKSAKDPYTNLLRQTTEAMSAVIGGAQTIIVTPYDCGSLQEGSELADRMAGNIALILQEESYFDKVIDPIGGSYTVEGISNELSDKAWKLFQELEAAGGIRQEAIQLLSGRIKEIRTKRIHAIREKERTLIGINKFPNIQTIDNKYIYQEEYLGMNFLNLENELV